MCVPERCAVKDRQLRLPQRSIRVRSTARALACELQLGVKQSTLAQAVRILWGTPRVMQSQSQKKA